MLSSARAKVRALLVFLAVLAIAVAACGGGSSTATNGGGGGGNAATASTGGNGGGGNAATDNGGGNGGSTTVDVGSAASKLGAINSYKFHMEMAGGSFDQMAGMFGGDTKNGFVVQGTVIAKPEKAADVTMLGFRVIEVGGKTYTNMLGTWTSGDASGSSMADSFAPEKMFSGYSGYGWKSAGEGTKNGVACYHYTVSAADMGAYAGMLGVTGTAEWTVETWIAKDGGYPVNMTLTAKQGSTYAFKFIMDITNVNDPANKVVAPI